VKICLLVKVVFVFALGWNSANFLCTTEKLLCFIQECREMWGKTAWKQVEDEKYGAIHPKKGKAKAENVNNMHELSDIDNSHCMSSKSWETGLYEGILWSLEQYLCASIWLMISAMVTISDNVLASWS
jgi:hypothetical protein